MAKVVGLGGVFFKAQRADELRGWYRDVLGLEMHDWGGALLWNDSPPPPPPPPPPPQQPQPQPQPQPPKTYGVFAVFEDSTPYMLPSEKAFMINFRVDDLDAILAAIRERGGNVLERRDDSADGRFGYVVDPEGTLIELWQPPPPPPPSYVPAEPAT